MPVRSEERDGAQFATLACAREKSVLRAARASMFGVCAARWPYAPRSGRRSSMMSSRTFGRGVVVAAAAVVVAAALCVAAAPFGGPSCQQSASSLPLVPFQGPSPDRLTAEAAAPAAAVRFHKHDSRNTGSPLRDSQIPLSHGSCSHSRCRGRRVASYLLLCPLRGTHTSLACPTMCSVAMKAKRLPAGLKSNG